MQKIIILFSLFASIGANGQASLSTISDTTPVFCDIHMHLSLKKYYQKMSYDSTLNWHPYKDKQRPLKRGKRSTFKNYIEADYYHMDTVNYDIVCEALMPLEKNTVNNSGKRILNNLGTRISFKRLRKVNDSHNTSFNEMLTQYSFLRNQVVTNPYKPERMGGFKLVENRDSLISARAKGLTAVVLTIEGGNALYDTINSSNVFTAGNLLEGEDAWQQELLNRVETIKQFDHKVFFMSLTHFGWTRIAGQGKAVDHEVPVLRLISQALSGYGPTHKSLHNKWSAGLVDTIPVCKPGNKNCDPDETDCVLGGDLVYDTDRIGERILDRLLDSSGKHNSPVYIDIRHMDIRSRLDYYSYLKKRKAGNKIPIIMSHAAVSGEDTAYALITGSFPYFDRYAEVKNPFKFYQKNKNFDCFKNASFNPDKKVTGWFNPWSVNLATEEIPIIYDSDGMIGLIFFDLTLGSSMINYKKRKEKAFRKQFEADSVVRNNQFSKTDLKDYLKAESFMRNMFYIVEHSGRNDETAWDHLCIGSDFDSGMDPIDISPSAKSMPDFYRKMAKLIPVFASLNNKSHLLYGLPPEIIVRKVFHDNMYRFIKSYF